MPVCLWLYVFCAGQPYRHAVWLPAAAIEAKRPSLLRNFLSRHAGGDADTDWADNNNINPAWYRVSSSHRARTRARLPPLPAVPSTVLGVGVAPPC